MCAVATNLRDTLLVHPSEEDRPGDLARVLALEEKGLGLAILEAEDLAVTTDIELALQIPLAMFLRLHQSIILRPVFVSLWRRGGITTSGGGRLVAGGRRNAPCPGRSSDR